jgi:hypothetical protein
MQKREIEGFFVGRCLPSFDFRTYRRCPHTVLSAEDWSFGSGWFAVLSSARLPHGIHLSCRVRVGDAFVSSLKIERRE